VLLSSLTIAEHAIFVPEEEEPLRISIALFTMYALDAIIPPGRYTELSNSTATEVSTETPVALLSGVTVTPVLILSTVVKLEVYSAFSLPEASSSDDARTTTT